MNTQIDTNDTNIRQPSDAELEAVTGGLAVSQPLISNPLVAAIEQLKSELRVALPRF